jgi:hypothetical protein
MGTSIMFTSSAREKWRATVTTPALSGEEGKVFLGCQLEQ